MPLSPPPEVGYSHVSRADRFTQRWLEESGYRYNALSDLDLHRDSHALDGAKVLFIVGHSEYWTREAMQRVREFLDRGGNVVCLSGNTMYWRVTHSDDDQILECRKADAWGMQLADYMRGECWHEHDQRRGGVPATAAIPSGKRSASSSERGRDDRLSQRARSTSPTRPIRSFTSRTRRDSKRATVSASTPIISLVSRSATRLICVSPR